MTGLPIEREVQIGSRVSNRIDATETATLYRGESVIIITILDMGLEGFGLLSPHPLDQGETVNLDIPEEAGAERYICQVSFCRKESNGYAVGLRIIDHGDDLVLIQEEI
ncbi:MAG: PilZ domain-containing protein [Magnetococcales bacterium]|nr:PilZ domain-containing protein [Magnetococcales bacterium]